MSIAINSNFERDQYQATFTGETDFDFTFPIFDETYLSVFKYAYGVMPDDRTQKLTLGVDYSVNGVGLEAGGTITLTVGATIGDIITVVGTEPIDRTSVFPDFNPFTESLNQQLNTQTVLQQQTYTYWNHVTPRYNIDELVSNEVRPQKRILPMLPDGHVWVGRGALNTDPDDIVTALLPGGGGGDVNADHPGMRPSIALWTGTDFVLTDSDLNISGALIDRTTTGATEDSTGFTDVWGAMHWPAHGTANRPVTPANGDTYYDTDQGLFFGYQAGVWVPFTTGASTGGSVTETITQANAFIKGDWIRLDVGSDTWVLAQGDNEVNAECFGMVLSSDGASFVFQQVGMVDNLTKYGPLVPGTVYFLDPNVAGNMVTTEPSTNGEVSLPVFRAKGVDYGEILNFRGLVIGTGLPINPGDGLIKRTIHQVGHGLLLGDYLRLNGTLYVRAQGDNLPDAQGVGFAVQIIGPDDFVIQVDGYVGPGVFDARYTFTPGDIYYADVITAGDISTPIPTGDTDATKPAFVASDTNAGWILPQRPLENTSTVNPNTILVTQAGHGFVAGNIVKITAVANVYSKALANTMANAYKTAGVVMFVPDANHFVLQQSGFGTFSAGQPPLVGLVAGNNYFLSPTVLGSYTTSEPATPFASRPVMLATDTLTAWILPQRPIISASSSNAPVVIVNQVAHGFVAGQWVKNVSTIGTPKTYALAQANTLANAYKTSGIVAFVIDANNFILQQNGYLVFDAGQPPSSALVIGDSYFLSPTVAGGQQVLEPAFPLPSRPTFQATAALEGWVLPQKPTVIPSGSGSGGGMLQSLNYVFRTRTNHNPTVANAWINLPTYSGTITPGSVSSRIKITMDFLASYQVGNGSRMGLAIGRNGVVIPACLGLSDGLKCTAVVPNTSDLRWDTRTTFIFYDSASTTSPITYSLMFNAQTVGSGSGGHSDWLHLNGSNSPSGGTSHSSCIGSITLEEIA